MRMLSTTKGFLFVATAIVAVSFIFQIESASADCRVNQISLKVAELTNWERTKYYLRPLQFNCRLYRAAQAHTVDMFEMKRMSHEGSDGRRVKSRVRKFGYEYSWLGENVAHGQKTPEEVVKAWMNSSGHRKNILNPNYTEIGVGYLNNYWTQVFGRSR